MVEAGILTYDLRLQTDHSCGTVPDSRSNALFALRLPPASTFMP